MRLCAGLGLSPYARIDGVTDTCCLQRAGGALIEQARSMQMPCVEPPESQDVDRIWIKLFEDLREQNRVLPRTTPWRG